ncbi:MAG: lipid kinase [Bacteroidaceae bacterium]|nr:lipid kinase [Bacteroidaceae bacterium]
MEEKNRWGVIYSSHSGSHKAHKRWTHIRTYMEQKGVQYDFVQSESFGSVERLVTMLCQNAYHTIIIVGGDGALNDAINAIMHSRDQLPPDFALGTIPNGIGNDFARFWGFTDETWRQTVDSLIARRTRKVDVAYCVYQDDTIPQKRYFLDCMNIGLGAKLIKGTNDAARLIGSKRLSLIPALLARIFERKSFPFKMQIDTETIAGEYMSVCIGNAQGYGQTPNAVPYSGLLDLSAVTRPKWWQLFEGFWLLGKGQFLNYKNVHPYRASKIIIEECGKAPVSLDGLYLPAGSPTPIRIGLEREAVDFIV